MKDPTPYLSLIICIAGLIIWHVCIRLKEPPTGIGDTGRIMFWAGLLAWLFGK